MPEIPTLSLKTVQFQPTVFTPSQYEYQAADMSILERSLAQREARMKEAAQNKSAIDRTLGELELKLNPAEAEWFEGYKQDIRNQIQSSIDSGDYGAAIRNATTLAGSVIQDPRILGRIRSQEAYQKELQTQQARRDRGEISQNTYDWWINNNKYSYTDSTDGNGNYVESSPWEAESRPVKDINWAEQAITAFKLITPKKNTTNKSGDYSTTNVDGTDNGSKWVNNSSFETVNVEDILANIDELLDSTPDGRRQAEQAYNVAMFDFKRLKDRYDTMSPEDPEYAAVGQQLENRKKLMYKNASPISYQEYYARMVTNNRYASTLAYEWRTSENSSFSNTDLHPQGIIGSSTLGGGYTQFTTNPFGNWRGPLVKWGSTYNFGTLGSATFGITSRF